MTSLRPPQRIPLCKLGSKSRGLSSVNDTAQAGDLEFERLWPPLKGIYIKKYIGKLYYPIAITITQKLYGLSKDLFGLPLRPKSAISKSNIFGNSKPYATGA
jgi:hypothetical protein